jgi:hypothetical protein
MNSFDLKLLVYLALQSCSENIGGRGLTFSKMNESLPANYFFKSSQMTIEYIDVLEIRGIESQMVANRSNDFYAEESEKYPIIFQQ